MRDFFERPENKSKINRGPGQILPDDKKFENLPTDGSTVSLEKVKKKSKVLYLRFKVFIKKKYLNHVQFHNYFYTKILENFFKKDLQGSK